MRTIELAPGLHSSVLGFGCAPILGAIGDNASRRALFTALDEGITHFDVAPSYGFGDAEAWLGRELCGKRGNVILATKYGIVATPLARVLRPLKPLVRIARGLRRPRAEADATRPKVEKATELKSDPFHSRLTLCPEGLRQSIETSLRRLRTDYLDWLWLHEPQVRLAKIDELSVTVAELKREGKLRAWGLAYLRAQEDLHRDILGRFDALQFNLSPGAAGYEEVRDRRGDSPNAVFSPFRDAPPDMARGEVLRRLSKDFPRTVILCSMFSPDHIRANCRAIAS